MLELGPVLFGGDEKIYWLSEAKKKLLASTMDCSRHWKKSSVATKAIHTSKYAKAVSSQYPSTRVILNATDIYIYIYIQQPKLPELQQMTFSNYKNDNTFKA